MKLKKAQKEALLTWIAEGLDSDEINKRAAQFRPRFKVLRSQVTYYRNSRDHKLEEIKAADEANALQTGYAVRENRVAALQKLAEVVFEELTREVDNRIWTENAKGIGAGEFWERYDYEEFNKAEFDTFRGLLGDIADEVGGRIKKLEHGGPGGGPIPVKYDDTHYDRSISSLADAVREAISGKGPKKDSALDTTE